MRKIISLFIVSILLLMVAPASARATELEEKKKENELNAYRRAALRVARDFRAPKEKLDRIRRAKNENQIVNIMVDIRRAI